MNNVEMLLIERKYIQIPKYLSISNEDYTKIIYELMKTSWAGQKTQYVIGCYSRSITPMFIENVGMITDIHFLELLADLAHWFRTKNDRLLESIYFKYLKNTALYYNNYQKATFYEWLCKDKQYVVPIFTPEDYKTAFNANCVAVMHESAHFIEGNDDFEILFEEKIIPDSHFKDRSPEFMTRLNNEAKADYMGLLLLMKAKHYMLPEQIVEMYFYALSGNCFVKSVEQHFKNDYTDQEKKVQSYFDRAYVIVKYWVGMSELFPELDVKKIDLKLLEVFPEGLRHLGEFMSTQMPALMKEYNALQNSYKEGIYRNVVKLDNQLMNQREYVVYPKEL